MAPQPGFALPDDAETVADLITAAFAEDPVLNWMFARPGVGALHRRMFFGIAAASAIRQGHAHVLRDGDEIVAGALWSAPGRGIFDDQAGPVLSQLMQAAEPERIALMMGGFKQMADLRPDESHFYLGMLGTDPSRRGGGLGGQLLRAGLDVVDRFGAPAYLESSNPRNVSLYERHGFEVTAELHLPEGPIMRGMWRPRST
ncbi:MAG: GNAT family N-acetyltransferase [Actinomycetota bacterium]